MARADDLGIVAMLADKTDTGSSGVFGLNGKGPWSFHAHGLTTNATGAAVIVIEATNIAEPSVDADWVTAWTISLTLGTTRTGDGVVITAPWANVRARVSSISGTGAKVSVALRG